MKSQLIFAAGLTTVALIAACSPNNTPQTPAPAGLCRNNNCLIGDKASMDYFSKFMTGTIGSCADQTTMSFTSMTAEFAATKENSGFSEVRLYVHADGTYNGVYVAQPATPTDAPALTKFGGTYYLENDKMVLSDFGIARRETDDEVIIQTLTSTKLDLAFAPAISFVQEKLTTNEQGQTVAQVCAAEQAANPTPTPAPTASPAP